MLFSLRRKLVRAWFDHQCRGILRTPPVETVDAPLTVVSMVSHADVRMYLVAMKSLYRRLGRGKIVAIDDGSLLPEDKALLAEHLKGMRTVPLASLDTGRCPRGGTWERLLLIMDLSETDYVIQMDSDTVATGPLPEVLDCVAQNRAFTLGTRMGQRFVTFDEATAAVAAVPGGHVQIESERSLAQLADADKRRYVRGSSGFAGFARGGFDRARVEAFSQEMVAQLGQRWTEWGTEQVTSNYVVANSPDAMVLPYPKYACFDLDMDPGEASFLHFIGTNRFDRGVYASYAHRIMEAA